MIVITQGYCLSNPLEAVMFADRKKLFVDLLKWDVPVVDGDFEVDQFDSDGATYIMAVDGPQHLGSLRLLPTNAPHILSTLFPSLCNGDVPRGPGISEITRLCLPPRLDAPERLRVRNALISAMVDHAFVRAGYGHRGSRLFLPDRFARVDPRLHLLIECACPFAGIGDRTCRK